MFASIGNIFFTPQPPALTATALPNSIALRVPYDNVAPSVSSTQLDNNASSNNSQLPKTTAPQLSAAEESIAEKFNISVNSNFPSLTANAQTTFFTKLASGDISTETHGLFLQYEKLLSYANVKYKPSNAGKPVEPIGIFGAILQQEKETALRTRFQPEQLPPPQVNISEEPALPAATFYPKTPEALPQPKKEILLPEIQAYSQTISRNQAPEPKGSEIA